MRIGVVLGAGREAMRQRLDKALANGYDKLFTSGRRYDPEALDRGKHIDELGFLEQMLHGSDVDYNELEVFTTFGSNLAVCDATTKDDEIVFYGHESHTLRMAVFKYYFNGRNLQHKLIEDPNLQANRRVFDLVSAAVYFVGLHLTPGLIKQQTRNKNSLLNQYIIPLKNLIVN